MRLSVKNARSGIDAMVPSIALVANAFWIAWIELIYSGEVYLGPVAPDSFAIIANYAISTISMGGMLVVLGLFPKAAQRMVRSGRLVVGAGICAGLATWGDMATGSPLLVAFTGVFTAVLADRFAFVLAEVNPKTVMLAQVASQILASLIYGYILYLPLAVRPWFMCFLPVMAAVCAFLTGDLFSGEPAEAVETKLTSGFVRLVVALVVFTVAINIVRGFYPSMIEMDTFSEVRGASSVLFFIVKMAVCALVIMLPVTVNLSKISYYSLLVLSFAGLSLPLVGLDSSTAMETFGCINALLNIVMWTLFAGIAYNTGRSSVRVFGIGWGLVSISSVAGWGIGFALFAFGFDRSVVMLVEVLLLAAMIVSCTLVVNMNVVTRLFLPADGDTEEAVEGLAIGGREPAADAPMGMRLALETQLGDRARGQDANVPPESVKDVDTDAVPDRGSESVTAHVAGDAEGPGAPAEEGAKSGRRGKWSHAVLSMALENGLSSRETDVLFLLLQGNSKQKVSEELCVSYNTVRSHVRNIYSKCDVHSQQDLINLFETYLHA